MTPLEKIELALRRVAGEYEKMGRSPGNQGTKITYADLYLSISSALNEVSEEILDIIADHAAQEEGNLEELTKDEFK